MKAGVAGGQLMFTLADGSSISCPCVGEPYAGQIAAEVKALVGAVEDAVEWFAGEGMHRQADALRQVLTAGSKGGS
jgi:hypothetical protein